MTEDLAAERDGSGRPTGRLNHPILLVHGYGTNSESFGVDFGDETCLAPRLLANPASRYTTNGSWLVLESRIPLQCANGWTPQWVRRDSLVKLGAPFFAQSAIPEQPPASNPSNRSTSALGRIFHWDDWLGEAKNRRLIHLDSVVPFRIKRAEHVAHDRLMSYHPNSIPGVLARTFGLDTTWNPTTPDSGINANGIYVFNARSGTEDVWEMCPDPRLRIKSSVLEWKADGTTSRIGQMELARYRPKLTADAEMWCPASGKTRILKSLEGFIPGRERLLPPGTPTAPYTQSDWRLVADSIGRQVSLLVHPERGSAISRPILQTYTLWADTADALFLTGTKLPFLSGLSPLDSGTASAPGQPRQVLERIRAVMDKHYGANNWSRDSTAQIDLVAHSQGGLVIRAMLSEPFATSDTTLANPLRHIRRVVTLGTPHFGTAAATPSSILRQPATDLDPSLGQRPYPELADLKDAIANSDACELPPLPDLALGADRATTGIVLDAIQARAPHGCLLIHAPLPYTVNKPAAVEIFDPVLSIFKPIPDDGTYTGRLVLFGPKAGPWTLRFLGFEGADLPDRPINLEGIAGTLSSMKRAKHLAWPLTTIDSSTDTIRYNEMETLRRLDARYPRYPGSDIKIPFHTFTSSSVGNLTQDVFAAALENLKAGCPVDFRDGNRFTSHKLFVMTETTMGVDGTGSSTCIDFRHAMDVWAQQARAQFAPLDLDWSQAGDMVVEAPSQRGEQIALPGKQTDWNLASSPELRPDNFATSNVLHGITPIRMSFAQFDPGHSQLDWRLRAPDLDLDIPSGPLEGCDVVKGGLGVIAPTGCTTTPIFVSPMASPLLRVSAPSGSWGLVIRNPTSRTWQTGWSLELPILAASQPSPRLAGWGISPEVRSAGDHSWLARFVIPEAVAARGVFRSAQPLIFTPGPEASFPIEELTADSSGEHLAILRETSGRLVGGAPSEATTGTTPLPVEIQVSRAEGDNSWLRPAVHIINQGFDTLRTLKIQIALPGRPDGAAPTGALWNTPWPARGTLSIQPNGADWSLTIRLQGLDLAPGEVLENLRFGVHWPDWSPWTAPILPSTPSSVDWAWATRTVSDAVAESPPPQTADLRIEGLRERLEPNLHALRLRFTSTSTTTGLRVSLPIEVPTRMNPVLESWWPQGCQGIIQANRLNLACPDATLQTGIPWPDATGAAIGLHDRDWTPWAVGATGLTSLTHTWTEVIP